MIDKNKVIDKLDEFCQHLGINPMFPLLLIVLLIGIRQLRDIKVWNQITMYDKIWDIILWAGVPLVVIFYVSTFPGCHAFLALRESKP